MVWIMKQTWHDLLFAHWPVRPEIVRPLVPENLELDTFDGWAWVGIVPFCMSGIRLRMLPPFPGVSAFAEMNVRTYVTDGQRPGVYFFSLDAASRLAVKMARAFYHLLYYHANMDVSREGDVVHYRSERKEGSRAALFEARYGPVSGVFHAEPGTPDHWLTERYCLYTTNRGKQLCRCNIDHVPWPLQRAEAEIWRNTAGNFLSTENGRPPRFLHFADKLEVRIGPLVRHHF